ncbi:MAG: SsgA family sporulation/cell division regulator [Nocardioides sp.]
MSAAPHVISSRVDIGLVGPHGATPVEAELRYDPADPYAVSITFLVRGSEVVWVFGRDLLLHGVTEPVGDGDVQVLPSIDADGRAQVLVSLTAPSGQALVEVRARDVHDFLALTAQAVWPGTEGDRLSADDAIAAILVGD